MPYKLNPKQQTLWSLSSRQLKLPHTTNLLLFQNLSTNSLLLTKSLNILTKLTHYVGMLYAAKKHKRKFIEENAHMKTSSGYSLHLTL